MVRNVASKRVLERLGMSQEGCLRWRVRKWGVFEDVLLVAQKAMVRIRFQFQRLPERVASVTCWNASVV
jgi:hypothetical protein